MSTASLWIIIAVFLVIGVGIGITVVLVTSTKRKGPTTEESLIAEAEAGRLTRGGDPGDEEPRQP